MRSTAWGHLRAIRKHGNDSRTHNSNDDDDRNDDTEGDDTNDETYKLTVLV